MTAAEIVRLAERAADECFIEYLRGEPWGAWLKGCIFNVFRDGSTSYERAVMPGAVMHAELTAENTSSRDALRDALIASLGVDCRDGCTCSCHADAEGIPGTIVCWPENGLASHTPECIAPDALASLLTTPSEAR